MVLNGRCLCGAVRFVVDGPLRDVWNCHCFRCRQFTGHYLAATLVQRDDVEFSSQGGLRWYSPEPTVEYGFCGECGSSLFWRTTAQPQEVSICAGGLNQPTGLRTTAAWWMSEHGDYHNPPAGLEEYEFDG